MAAVAGMAVAVRRVAGRAEAAGIMALVADGHRMVVTADGHRMVVVVVGRRMVVTAGGRRMAAGGVRRAAVVARAAGGISRRRATIGPDSRCFVRCRLAQCLAAFSFDDVNFRLFSYFQQNLSMLSPYPGTISGV